MRRDENQNVNWWGGLGWNWQIKKKLESKYKALGLEKIEMKDIKT